MKDLGENPIATMLYAMWDLIKWWVVIALTWGGGLVFGFLVGGVLRDMGWHLMSQFTGITCFSVIPGLGVTIAALCLPIAMDSRRLAIGAAVTNFTVWMLIGAGASLDCG